MDTVVCGSLILIYSEIIYENIGTMQCSFYAQLPYYFMMLILLILVKSYQILYIKIYAIIYYCVSMFEASMLFLPVIHEKVFLSFFVFLDFLPAYERAEHLKCC